MGRGKNKKTEGGQGGGRGHSSMTHWDRTEDIKRAAKSARRSQDRAIGVGLALAQEAAWLDLGDEMNAEMRMAHECDGLQGRRHA